MVTLTTANHSTTLFVPNLVTKKDYLQMGDFASSKKLTTAASIGFEIDDFTY